MRRLLLTLAVLAGCGDARDEEPAVAQVTPKPPVVSPAFADSVHAVFVRHPDSVTSLMRPDLAPDDVRIATALLERSTGEAKLRFVEYLVQQGKRSVEPLRELVARSDDWNTQVSAIQTLGKLEAVEAVDVISDRLHDDSSWVRMAAAHALGDIGGSDARRSLIPALEDTSDTVVAAVLIGLGKLGDRSAVEPCAALLAHDNPRVRAAAVSALGRIGGPGDIQLLDGLRNDADSGVRFKVQQAVQRMQTRGAGE